MGALLNILFHSFGSMIIGVLLTVVGILLMYVLIRLWWRNCTFTLQSLLVGFVLFFFLSFQSILMCGALTIKSYAVDLNLYVNRLVSSYSIDKHFTTQESQYILDTLSEQWPLIGYYLNLADFEGHTPLTIADAMTDEMCSYMNWFILRRVLWALFFVVVAAVIVIKTISFKNVSRRRQVGGMARMDGVRATGMGSADRDRSGRRRSSAFSDSPRISTRRRRV